MGTIITCWNCGADVGGHDNVCRACRTDLRAGRLAARAAGPNEQREEQQAGTLAAILPPAQHHPPGVYLG